MVSIAKTLFETGPDDELITADSYSGSSDSSSSADEYNYPPALDSRGKVKETTANQARSGSVNPSSIVSAVSAGLVGRNDAQLSRRASQATGSTTAYNSLSQSLKDEILFDLTNGAYGNTGAVRATVSGVDRTLNSSQLESAQGITRFLVNLTGNQALAQTADLAGEMAVFNRVLRKAIDLGVVDVIDTLWEEAKDKERAKQMLIDSLRYLAFSSQLDGINKVIGYIGRHEALSREPDLINMIMTFYKFPDRSSRADYNNLFVELKGCLDNVNPNWHQYRRNGQWISDLSAFTYASDDALTLFRREAQWRTIAYCAPAHRSRPLLALARMNYPRLGLV